MATCGVDADWLFESLSRSLKRPLPACQEQSLFTIIECHALLLPACYRELISGGVNGTNMTSADDIINNTDYDTLYHQYDECVREMLEDTPEYQAATRIQKFFYPILLLLSTVGNLASMVILRQLSIEVWSSCLYLSVLCPIDLLVLYIKCGSAWLLIVFNVNPSHELTMSSDATCKTLLFVTNLLIMLWPWLVVALAVELMISTRFPLKTYDMCTRERARATVLLITILLVCLNLHFFWTWGHVKELGCRYIEEFTQEFMSEIWPAITMTVQSVLPLFVVTFCFFVSVVSLIRSGRAGRATYEPILKKYFLDLQALKQLKHAALILTLMFLVVKTYELTMSVLGLLEIKGLLVIACEKRNQYKVSMWLAHTLGMDVYYTFASLKFLVYFALCARFRTMCYALGRKMICCPRLRDKPSVSGNKNGAQNSDANNCSEQKYAPVSPDGRYSGVAPHQVIPLRPGLTCQNVPSVTTKV